ncbi:MAG: hypothetical protein R3C12_12165 [Planctomycetaceae bacterium]
MSQPEPSSETIEAQAMSDQDTTTNPRPNKRGVKEGLWLKCPNCGATVFRKQVDKLLGICPECDYHFYVGARTRIEQLLDVGSFEEWFQEIHSVDLSVSSTVKPYGKRLISEQKPVWWMLAWLAGGI